ncbi:methionine biosynthesis protein MetW [Thioflexithrix psekupsensis]|uniref:Methionine biosynthesis protein MetW n=1 Tax=Thioflexithrix psekupsensis TaxID=1570016 RepID=A0A251X8D1_9GAMM|nr:methionine biosynthesis protein MetW [Thioflexithrix psekupsensis]OUD14044.1 methionine biosynthesis protein MetW [Thioflexithrix psekupsensis]
MKLRTDLALLSDWIKPHSHVLDLGCGDGTLLAHLRDTRSVSGYGVDIDENKLIRCIEAGIYVIHSDLNKGLSQFSDKSFDNVILTQTLQALKRPDLLLLEMMRVGEEAIVTFPNFGHWACRFDIFFRGQMPLSRALPNEWYRTENIHLCTLKDFEQLCQTLNINIMQRAIVDTGHRSTALMRLLPNLMGEIAIYRLRLMPKVNA